MRGANSKQRAGGQPPKSAQDINKSSGTLLMPYWRRINLCAFIRCQYVSMVMATEVDFFFLIQKRKPNRNKAHLILIFNQANSQVQAPQSDLMEESTKLLMRTENSKCAVGRAVLFFLRV